MALFITTPGFLQQFRVGNQEFNQDNLAQRVYMTGEKSRRIITIQNDDASPASFSLYLTQSGDSFSINPSLGATVSLLLQSSSKTTVTIDHNSIGASGEDVAYLTSDTDIYGLRDDGLPTSVPMLGPSVPPLEFVHINYQYPVSRNLSALITRDKDGEFQISQAGEKLTQDETSFGIIRTNPKLTGNVKITVDSANDIWLNSIDAEKELADDRFKKYRISPNSSYVIDIRRFFDDGGTPPEIVYSLYQADTQYTSTKRNLSQQYDRFYQYGVTPLKSKFYPEDFSFFAPLYLKEDVPDYFVIFRTDGPVNNFSYDLSFDQWPSEVRSQILDNSRIIKTYNMQAGTSIGDYLRNLISHPSRKPTDLTVSYQQNGYTTFNGIVYNSGSFAQMGELLYDYVNQENPLISVEEFITLGFERNKVISSHVLNMEFLFDDPTADNYTINRYFGLYVNAIDLAKFQMNGSALQEYSLEVNQLPLPRRGVDGSKISQKSFVQTNDTGIRIYADFNSVQRLDNKSPEKLFSSYILSGATGATAFAILCPGDITSRIAQGEQMYFSTASGLTASALLNSFSYGITGETTSLIFSNDSYQSTTTLPIFLVSPSQWGLDFYTEEKYESYRESIFADSLVTDRSRFFYVKDNDGNFHSVKSTRTLFTQASTFTQEKVVELTLRDTKLDISNFGGFSSLLTQADAKVLDTVGRSSMKLKVNEIFSANDYIEISWEPGPTALGHPLRWRAKANTTGLTHGEVWPSYALTSDSEGEYYLSYFHPGTTGGKFEDFVKSICGAFDQFPYKNFEVVSSGSDIYFRSTQEGIESENARISFYTDIPGTISIMDIPTTGATGSQNFIGGSKRKRTRARIPTTVAKGMLSDEYLSLKGSFSLIKEYDILGESIIFSPYLEEPVYDENGEVLVKFNDADKYSIITVLDEAQEIQLTSDDKITTYQLFQPSYGVLSVLPLRDFDTDFYSSEYSKSYLPELLEYFYRGGFSPVTVTDSDTVGSTITLTFSQGITFPSGTTFPNTTPYLVLSPDGANPPILQNSLSQLTFSTDGATTATLKYTLDIDNEILNNIPVVGSTVLVLPKGQELVFTDEELTKFKGFLALSGIISAEDEAEFQKLENLWDPIRFTEQLLNSEYDRMSENYLKTLVLKSRVVPYTVKWVTPQGTDIRDNPYRFNYHRAFGSMNYTPSLFLQTADPRFHTHEWPYLDSVPINYPIQTYPEFAFSYFYDPVTSKYDFGSTRKDWFSEYFSVGYPTEKILDGEDYVSLRVDPKERYSYFNFENFTDRTFAFFRGQRIEIKELNADRQVVLGSTKYNNYRYSAIIRMDEDNAIDNQDPIEFKTVVNEKWKFILLVITVRTSTWKAPNGNMRYVDLYTLSDDADVTLFNTNNADPSSVSTYQTTTPADVKISYPLNLANYSQNPDLQLNFDYYDQILNDNKYVDSLVEQINVLPTGVYGDLAAVSVKPTFVATVNLPPPLSIFSRTTLQLNGNDMYLSFSAVTGVTPAFIPYSSVAWDEYTFYYEAGGENSMQGMRDRLSFSEIANVIQETSSNSTMVYEIYAEDGSVSNVPNFSLSMISPESLSRVFDYFPVSDPDKPAELYTYDTIGVILEEQKDLQTIYRYQGDFAPKFNDVLKFWLREDDDFTKATSKDFLFTNTHMGTELNGYGLLKNQFFMKVSTEEILRISPNSGYLPVYPLVNEIAIDKRDLFAWSSSWDSQYYRFYSSVSDFTVLNGTEEMLEIKSVLGSKCMKLPKQFDLYEFELTIPVVNPLKSFPSIANLQPFIDDELSFLENDTLAVLQVNVYERLLRELLGTQNDSRARTSFLEAIDLVPNTFSLDLLDSKVRDYLIKNVMELYEISDVKLYILQTGNPTDTGIATLTRETRPFVEYEVVDGVKYSLSESELLKRSYFQRKDSQVNNLGNMIFAVSYNIDTRYYTSVSVGVTVKRI